ncbi:MAG: hypothetical protein A2Y93_01595 [Chloroflexi bacterium RBG_13_68_17]|jgi:Flp pilus assembly protein TadD|nr:MAG: hypothetical protein A2Y93_01595 [Chloroflexi bacterium RBG_13_68_17]
MNASEELSAVLRQAWAEYGAGRYAEAAQLLTQAQTRFPDSEEIAYGLGMAHFKADRKDQARQAFTRAVELLERDVKQARGTMLRRLAKGHLNLLDKGTWDLEKEIWHYE